MNNQEIKQCFIIPKTMFYTYSSRASIEPTELLKKLQLTEEHFHAPSNGYILTRKQYTALLYKAGILKHLSELTDAQHTALSKIQTTDLIQELERRTRKG